MDDCLDLYLQDGIAPSSKELSRVLNDEDSQELTWSPHIPGTDLGALLSDTVLEAISACCNCSLVVDGERRLVIISEAGNVKHQSVCRKLDNIERNQVSCQTYNNKALLTLLASDSNICARRGDGRNTRCRLAAVHASCST